jgi:hypothetical protein
MIGVPPSCQTIAVRVTGGVHSIPHKKIKSREATAPYLLDPARLKNFILDLREYLKSTQHLCQKVGHENDPRHCVHRQLYDRPDTVMFRRFGHFCYVSNLDWEGSRAMLEFMLSDRFICEREMLWRITNEQVEEGLTSPQNRSRLPNVHKKQDNARRFIPQDRLFLSRSL